MRSLTVKNKSGAPRNRTLSVSEAEEAFFQPKILRIDGEVSAEDIDNRIIGQDLFEVIDWLPSSFVDLLFLDPPYNLNKTFNANKFTRQSFSDYADWVDSWFPRLLKTLKPNASVYICGEWRSSAAIQFVAEKYLIVRNRITWEREKGRGAAKNWKNCSEDIWFCTRSERYVFNTEAVKLRRRVIAPYTDPSGAPRDWDMTRDGNYRLTHPSNLWTDLTVPFWSMPENTPHPTQKPEKLLAKIILASSNVGDVILDPFLGSGTTAVVAKKLSRKYVGIEMERAYCLLALKRLGMAECDDSIQGYANGLFWERNSFQEQKASPSSSLVRPLFD